MALIISKFFGIIGLDFVPPTTMAELIPYILTILVSVAVVSIVVAFVGRLFSALCSIRKF